MKESGFLKFFLVMMAVASLAICVSSLCDDEDLRIEPACALDNLHLYDQLTLRDLFTGSISVNSESDVVLKESIIFYLEMHEKSPPALFSLIFV